MFELWPKLRCSFFQHLQTMLKTKLNVLTLRKDPLPTVIFHEPEAIELCSTTPHNKSRVHTGYKVQNLLISEIQRVDSEAFSNHLFNNYEENGPSSFC